MKKTKKIVALLLTLCMAFGMFANMAAVNAEAPEWFASAEAITEIAEMSVTTEAGAAKYYKYEATEDGFFDFLTATTTNTEISCTPYVGVYDEDGNMIDENSIANLNYFKVENGKTYYFEIYSRYYNDGFQKAADTMTIKAAVLVPQAITAAELDEVVTTLVDGGTKLYKFTATEDGIIDFLRATSANTTESTTYKPNVKVLTEEGKNVMGGSIFAINALFVEKDETYIFEISSQLNYKPAADTVTWSAAFCVPEELTVPVAGKTVTTEVAANGSKFYVYTSTVDGYFEIMSGASAAFATDPGDEDTDFTRIKIFDATGYNLESGTVDNISPVPVKVGDVLYIEVYSQGGYDYNTYSPIKIADTITWKVEAYECGTQASPEEIEDLTEFYQELVLEPDHYGRYYTHTAVGEGVVAFYPQYWSEECQLEIEIIVNNGEPIKFSASEDVITIQGYWGPEEFKAVKVSVEEGDELQIHVYEMSDNTHEVGLVGTFTPPEGRPGNPKNITEEGGEFEVAVGETFYIQIPYGMAAVMKATGDFSVIGTDYYDNLTEEMESVNGKLTVKGCYLLAVTNLESEAITVSVAIEYPEGSMENPYVLDCYNELDLRFAAYQFEFDYYTFRAKEDTTLYFEMPEIEAGAITGWIIQMYTFVDDPVEGQVCTGFIEMHPWLPELNNELSLEAGEYIILSIAPAVYDAEWEYASAGSMEAARIQCRIATLVENPFTDVEDGQYYATPVLWAAANGITSGYENGSFGVEDTCTRAQIVTFLWRAAGCPEPTTTTSTFTDLKDANAYFYKAVLWAAENGITSGYENGSFGINDPCTRAQIVTFLWRAAGCPVAADTTSPFTDVADANAYYYNAVLWAVENGITYGLTETVFGVDAPCTRAQVVTFLYRYFK